MRTIRNLNISNESFINWMLSTSSARRLLLLNNIGKYLLSRGFPNGHIVSAFRQIHTQPSVTVKRLSTKEISSYKRKKRKLSNLKEQRSMNKDNVKENSDFLPVITSVRSLQLDEEFDVFQTGEKIDLFEPIIQNECMLEDQVLNQEKNINTNNSKISDLESNIEEYERRVSEHCSNNDSLNNNKFTNISSEATQATADIQMSRTNCTNQNNNFDTDSDISRKIEIQKENISQTNNLQLVNNIRSNKTEPSGNELIIKLQENIKSKFMTKIICGSDKTLEEKIKQNLSNFKNPPKAIGKNSDTLNSKNIVQASSTKNFKGLKPQSVTQGKATSLSENTNKANETDKTQIQSGKAEEVSVSYEQDVYTANGDTKNVSEKVSKDRYKGFELECSPISENSSEYAIVERNKIKNKKGVGLKTYSRIKKKLDKSCTEQSKTVTELMPVDKLPEDVLINRKRAAKTNLTTSKPKTKEKVQKINEPEQTLLENSQTVKEKQQQIYKNMFTEVKNISNLQEVPSSSSTPHNPIPSLALDISQPEKNLNTENSNKSNTIFENSAQNINSIQKDDINSEHAISDSTVSSSSMIEKPSESSCSAHDLELAIESVISENNSPFVSFVVEKDQEPLVKEKLDQNSIKACNFLLSSKFTDGNILPPHLTSSFEEKLLSDSVNLYLSYFEKPNQTYACVPEEIQLAIKNYILSKENRDPDITVRAVIKEYLSMYIKHFDDEINNVTANKAAEILHLAIADYNRREERKKLAVRLNSNFLRNEELTRADNDYKEILNVRGNTFSEMYQSVFKKCEKCIFMLMSVTFYFKITQALLLIDSENINYFRNIRNLMLSLLSTHNIENSLYQFFNLPNSELERSYKFVKDCLVSFYLTRYIQPESSTQDPNEFKFALFWPCSVELNSMVFDSISKNESLSENMFAIQTSNKNSSLTQIQEDDSEQRSVTSRKLIQADYPIDTNVNTYDQSKTKYSKKSDGQHTSTLYLKRNISRDSDVKYNQNAPSEKASTAVEQQPITNQHDVEQNKNITHASGFHQNEIYNQQTQFNPVQKNIQLKTPNLITLTKQYQTVDQMASQQQNIKVTDQNQLFGSSIQQHSFGEVQNKLHIPGVQKQNSLFIQMQQQTDPVNTNVIQMPQQQQRSTFQASQQQQRSTFQASQQQQRSTCQASQQQHGSIFQASQQQQQRSTTQASQQQQRSTTQASQQQQRSTFQASQQQQGNIFQASQQQQRSMSQASQQQQRNTCQASQQQQSSIFQTSQPQQSSISQASHQQQGSIFQASQPQQRSISQASQQQQRSTFQASQQQPGSTFQATQQQLKSAIQIRQQQQVHRQNQSTTIPFHHNRFEPSLQRQLVQVQQQSQRFGQNQLIRTPGQTLPKPDSYQPAQGITPQQSVQDSIHQPSQSSMNIEPSTSTSLPQFHHLLNQTKQRQSLQLSGRSRQNERVNQSLVTNMPQMHSSSQHAIASTNVLPPPQYPWRNQSEWPQELSSQHYSNPQGNESNHDFLIVEQSEPKTCAVKDCQRLATVACSSCKAIFYCSCDCQKNHWYNEHSGECCANH